jgi:hypothetical protein
MDEANDTKERLDSLSQANINALSGTGCVNIYELRMAFDFLRERLAIRYKDRITNKEILNEVTRRMYVVQDAIIDDQRVFDFAKE